MLIHNGDKFLIMWEGDWGNQATFCIIRKEDRVKLHCGSAGFIRLKWSQLNNGEQCPTLS